MMIVRRIVMGCLLPAVMLSAALVDASPYSDSVLTDSPVGYWRLDETALPTATNVGTAGASIDATYVNLGTGTGPKNIGQVGPRPGDIAGGYAIDGLEAGNLSMHLATNTNPDFPRAQVVESAGNALDITGQSPSTGLTLEVWVRRDPQANSTNNEGIVAKYAGSAAFGANRSYALYYDPTPGVIGLTLSESGASQTAFDLRTPTDIPIDQWVHLAATYQPPMDVDPGRVAIYVNGQVAAETTNAANVPDFLFDSAADFWIGQQFDVGQQFTFEGRLDEVAVYSSALTSSQIAAHFAAATGNVIAVPSWVPNASGSWNNAANWTTGVVPNSNATSIQLGPAITASKVVYTESDVTVKSIRFDTSATSTITKYAVAGVGTVTLAADSGNASIQVARGAQEFQTPVTLGSNTDVTIATTAGSSLSFNNMLNLNGKTLHIVSGTVNFNHSVLPGAGGQIANIGGSLGSAAGGSVDLGGDFTNAGTLNIDLGGREVGEYTSFNTEGTAVLAGSLHAELVNGFTLSSGDAFTVFTAGNLINSGISLTGPLAGSLSLNVAGDSLVLSAGLPGDFNGDGHVNGGDYLTWRKGLGSVYSQSAYDLWRSNFGASSGAGSSFATSVPEPTSFVLLLVAALTVLASKFVRLRSNKISNQTGFNISPRFVTASCLFAIVLSVSAAEAGPYSDAVIANTPVAYWRLDETALPTATNIGTAGVSVDATFHNLGTGAGPLNIGQLGPRPGDIAGGFTIDGFEAANRAIHLAPVSPGLMDLFPRAQVDESGGNALDITGLSPSTGLTLEAWVRRDTQTNAGNNEGIISKFQGSAQFGSNRSYNLYYDPRSGGRVGFVLNSDGTSATNFDLVSPTDIPLDQWVHLAATYQPHVPAGEFPEVLGRTALFVNGQLVAERTGAANVPDMLFDSAAPVWIGQQFSDDPSTTFEGRIDEVSVYDKPLTDLQIAAHFAAATNDTPADINWGMNASGSWHTSANWIPGSVPNANTISVTFGTAITAPKVVYTESNVVAKSIKFDNNNKYAIAGTGTISLTAPSGQDASVQVVRGAQEFQAPVSLGSATHVNVASGAGNSLSFNNALTLNAKTLNLESGTVNINHSVVAGTGGSGVIVNGVNSTLGTAGATPIAGTFNSLGTLDIDLGGTGTNQFSAFNITGTATLSGFISPELVNGFTLSSGDTFTILTATSLSTSSLTLTGPLASALSLTKVGNTLVLTAAGLNGDFNHDNKVDAADYVVWRKGLGTTHVQNDYNVWRSNFGAVGAGSGSGVELGAAVPEPTSLVLFAAVCSLSIGMRRGFRR